MKIYNLRILQEDSDVKLSASIESEHLGSRDLWFSIPNKYEQHLCRTRMDGFLVGMLFPAMQYGENIHVSGCVSEKLLFNLNNYVVPLILAYSPFSKRIKITADQISSERFHGQGVGTAFSGGIDSFCTIYDRFEQEGSTNDKINKLLFLNVGSHGSGNTQSDLVSSRRKFLARYNSLKGFADEINLDIILLDSNLHAFYPWGHQKAHTLTSAAGVLILQSFFEKYYYSSTGLSYLEIYKYYNSYLNKDIGIFDAILLPLLSTESLELISEGGQYSRVEKTLRIMNYEPVKRYLNVCVQKEQDSSENCSVCPKCCRTLMTLNSAGKINEFKKVFNIDKYKKVEQRYMCEQILLSRKDPFARGNVLFAKENKIKFLYQLLCLIVIERSFLKVGRHIRQNVANILKMGSFTPVIRQAEEV